VTFTRFMEILKDVEATVGAASSTVVLVKSVANEISTQKASGTLNANAMAQTLIEGANLAAAAVVANPIPVPVGPSTAPVNLGPAIDSVAGLVAEGAKLAEEVKPPAPETAVK